MDNTIKQILSETQSTNVEDIVFDEEIDMWVMTFKTNSNELKFEKFKRVLDYLRGKF